MYYPNEIEIKIEIEIETKILTTNKRNTMYYEPARSTLDFCKSMTQKYRELLKTGDMVEPVKRRPSRQKICVSPEAEANWLALIIKRIEEDGMRWPQAAKGTPWDGRPVALRDLAIRRGIFNPAMLKAKKAEARKRIDAEARRVNETARTSHKSLGEAIQDSSIDVNQYYSAKGRLNLPHIYNRVRN